MKLTFVHLVFDSSVLRIADLSGTAGPPCHAELHG